MKRVLPPDVEPVVSQSILNLALAGATLIDGDGVDITAAVRGSADEINRNYDAWLRKRRDRTSKSDFEERKERNRVRTRNGSA